MSRAARTWLLLVAILATSPILEALAALIFPHNRLIVGDIRAVGTFGAGLCSVVSLFWLLGLAFTKKRKDLIALLVAFVLAFLTMGYHGMTEDAHRVWERG